MKRLSSFWGAFILGAILAGSAVGVTIWVVRGNQPSTGKVQAISAGVQALAAITIVGLTVALVAATRRYADDTARMASQMKEQWESRYKQVSEQAALRLARALVQIEADLSKDRKNQAAYVEAFNRWQLIWFEEHGVLVDSELKERLEMFLQMLNALATEPGQQDAMGRIVVPQERAYRMARAIVATREILHLHGSGRIFVSLGELPHPERWGDWLDAPPGAKIEDYQSPKP